MIRICSNELRRSKWTRRLLIDVSLRKQIRVRPRWEQSSTERKQRVPSAQSHWSAKMAALIAKRQGFGLLRVLLVLLGVSVLCSVAVGTRKGHSTLDHRSHRHRHPGGTETQLQIQTIYTMFEMDCWNTFVIMKLKVNYITVSKSTSLNSWQLFVQHDIKSRQFDQFLRIKT